MAALESVGVPCGPVNDIAELAQTEQLQAVDLMRTLPGSGVKVVGLPITFDGERPHPHADAPKLGEHNDTVMTGARAAE
jgi:formyl-CoA transferase